MSTPNRVPFKPTRFAPSPPTLQQGFAMSPNRRSLRLRRIAPELAGNLANDPIAKLPDLCIDAIFSHFSPTELIGIQRVSKTWRDNVNWRFSREVYRKRWCPPLTTDDNEAEYGSWEEAALAFRRAVYRHEMRKRGEPTFIRKFTNANQGWVVCGDYFVWIDSHFINVQLIFDTQNPGRMVQPIKRFGLRKLAGYVLEGGTTQVRTLHVQETGGAREQPLLALVFLNQMNASQYPVSRVTVIDIVQGKVLWSVEEPEGSGFHCTLNRSVLSYLRSARPPFDVTTGEHCPPSLIVLDVLTGTLKSSTKLHLQRNSPYIHHIVREIRAHPRQELIFILLNKEIMVFSTSTMDWVGVLKLLVISTSRNYPPTNSLYTSGGGVPEIYFDEYEPKKGGHDKISICGLQCQYLERDSEKMNYFVIQSFELPTAERLETDNTEVTGDKADGKCIKGDIETSFKPLKGWKRQPIEILDARNVMTHSMMYPEVNLKAKQVAVMMPGPNPKSNRAIIHTYKEDACVPEVFTVLAAPGDGSSVKRKEKGMDSEVEIEIKWFTTPTNSEVTKLRKGLPKDTPYISRRIPATFSGGRGYKGPKLKERYMVFDQRTDVFFLSFSPAW